MFKSLFRSILGGFGRTLGRFIFYLLVALAFYFIYQSQVDAFTIDTDTYDDYFVIDYPDYMNYDFTGMNGGYSDQTFRFAGRYFSGGAGYKNLYVSYNYFSDDTVNGNIVGSFNSFFVPTFNWSHIITGTWDLPFGAYLDEEYLGTDGIVAGQEYRVQFLIGYVNSNAVYYSSDIHRSLLTDVYLFGGTFGESSYYAYLYSSSPGKSFSIVDGSVKSIAKDDVCMLVGIDYPSLCYHVSSFFNSTGDYSYSFENTPSVYTEFIFTSDQDYDFSSLLSKRLIISLEHDYYNSVYDDGISNILLSFSGNGRAFLPVGTPSGGVPIILGASIHAVGSDSDDAYDFDEKFQELNDKLDKLDGKIDGLYDSIDNLNDSINSGFSDLNDSLNDSTIDVDFDSLDFDVSGLDSIISIFTFPFTMMTNLYSIANSSSSTTLCIGDLAGTDICFGKPNLEQWVGSSAYTIIDLCCAFSIGISCYTWVWQVVMHLADFNSKTWALFFNNWNDIFGK